MRNEEPSRYAARLNSFRVGADDYWPNKNRVTTEDLLRRAATVDGLNAADLNYPDHFHDTSPKDLAAVLDRLGIELNGLAMRGTGHAALQSVVGRISRRRNPTSSDASAMPDVGLRLRLIRPTPSRRS